jgi:hypothetical protein
MNRRSFLKVGALFVPAVAAPTVAYSFLWEKPQQALPRATFCGIPFPAAPYWVVRDPSDRVIYEGAGSGAALRLTETGVYHTSVSVNYDWRAV